jgi:hypothetical protein
MPRAVVTSWDSLSALQGPAIIRGKGAPANHSSTGLESFICGILDMSFKPGHSCQEASLFLSYRWRKYLVRSQLTQISRGHMRYIKISFIYIDSTVFSKGAFQTPFHRW